MSEQVLRHPNGGAQKFDSGVHVSADSFCNYLSEICCDSAIFSSTLLDAKVCDSRVFNSTVEFSDVTRTTIAESYIDSLYAERSVLHKVKTYAPLGTTMRLLEVVAENCELNGDWVLEGNARIPTGTWNRAPRFCRITGENGVDVGLTESTEGHALMACWRKPLTTWLHAGPRLGRKHRWSEVQIQQAYDFFEMLIDEPLET